jgi:hypothetical protein
VYVVEEYFAAIVLAIVLGIAAMPILALVLKGHEEDQLFDRALMTGTFALPPSRPRVWVAIWIAERWRAFATSFGRRAELCWRRVWRKPYLDTSGKGSAVPTETSRQTGDVNR